MKRIKIYLLLCIIAFAVNVSAAGYLGAGKNTSYAFGFGTYKLGSAEIGFVPLDFKHRGERTHLGITIGYGLDADSYSTDHAVSLSFPVSFAVYNKGTLRFGIGFEFQNYLVVSNYFGTHTIGPLFSLDMPIPYNNSSNDFDFGVLFGVAADDYEAVFIVDTVFRDNFELYFNDKVGVHAGVSYTVNMLGGMYGFFDRALVYFGPCFRW